jgi:hypothetical protein
VKLARAEKNAEQLNTANKQLQWAMQLWREILTARKGIATVATGQPSKNNLNPHGRVQAGCTETFTLRVIYDQEQSKNVVDADLPSNTAVLREQLLWLADPAIAQPDAKWIAEKQHKPLTWAGASNRPAPPKEIQAFAWAIATWIENPGKWEAENAVELETQGD